MRQARVAFRLGLAGLAVPALAAAGCFHCGFDPRGPPAAPFLRWTGRAAATQWT